MRGVGTAPTAKKPQILDSVSTLTALAACGAACYNPPMDKTDETGFVLVRQGGAQALTPGQIVAHLDQHIVGQAAAKRAVAVALRNRLRRQRLDDDLQKEVMPKNILMIGPTGVGKTEIARRLAALCHAPFIKVEVTRFTEVGYVGRDVESLVRDLVQASLAMVSTEKEETHREAAEKAATEDLLDLLHPLPQGPPPTTAGDESENQHFRQAERIRKRLMAQLQAGEIEHWTVDLDTEEAQGSARVVDVFTGQGMEDMGNQVQEMLANFLPKRTRRRTVTVKEARRILTQQQFQRLLNQEDLTAEAITRAEQTGIVFLDEFDKIAVPKGGPGGSGPDISREGVQRDLLPIIEGATVNTRHGAVRTDHVLFIAAGAFHYAKPSDLIPELQGRMPIRVELDSLTEKDFVRILTEPKASLLAQYCALLATDGVALRFTEDGVAEIARLAFEVNRKTEDIGARRLHALLERTLEDVLFSAPDETTGEVVVDKAFVAWRLKDLAGNTDRSRFVL